MLECFYHSSKGCCTLILFICLGCLMLYFLMVVIPILTKLQNGNLFR